MLGGKAETLIENATLEIIEYDIHFRKGMNEVNRVLPYYVMSYLKEGYAQIRYKGKVYMTKPKTVIILPPNEAHDHIQISEDTAVFLWWHFNFKIANTIDILKLMHLPILFEMNNSFAFENVFNQYFDLCKKPSTIPNLVLKKAKGLEVMAFLFENALNTQENILKDKIPDVFIDILLDIIRNPEKNFELKYFSQKYNMNGNYVSNKFREYFNITPKKMQNEVLINKAKALIKSGEVTISEVASCLGFSDISTFSRFFSAKAGLTATKFKSSK